MKRLLLVILLCLMVIVPVSAAVWDFQNTNYVGYLNQSPYGSYSDGGGWCARTQTAYMELVCTGAGQNCYMTAQPPIGHATVSVIMNKYPLLTTYAASTIFSSRAGAYNRVRLYDANKAVIYTANVAGDARIEMQMVGGQAKIYRNGVLMATSGVLAVNPSYVGFGVTGWDSCGWLYPKVDDIVYGDTENKYVLGNPTENEFKIVKDTVNPANSGLAFASNGTIVSSNNMTTTWSRSNITYAGNETIVLKNVDTGTIYGTRYTNTASYGTVSWALTDEIFNSGAPYGRYYVTIPGTGAVSEEIWYTGSGASIYFDQTDYNKADTATMTYAIDGAYWDTSTYGYSIDVISGTTGATVQSTAISTSTGTSTYAFASTDADGVYYAVVKASPNDGSDDIWMNFDYAELSGYVTFTGYVNDAETELPITGANVNITQNDIIGTSTTTADGNYTATGYLTGASLSFNITAAGYSQYYAQTTVLTSKTINLNFSLNSTTPTYAGLGIGGITRDGSFDGTTITHGYGRPLASALVYAVNTSNAQTCTDTSNTMGWYLFDESTGCFLDSTRVYDVWAVKTGYANSANHSVVVPQ